MCRIWCTTDIPNISNGLLPTSQPQSNPLPALQTTPTSFSIFCLFIHFSHSYKFFPFLPVSQCLPPNSFPLSVLCPVSPRRPRPHFSVRGRKVEWVCGSPGEQQRLCLEESRCTPPYFSQTKGYDRRSRWYRIGEIAQDNCFCVLVLRNNCPVSGPQHQE